MQPKLQRIFSKLQLAKAEGVQEIDILDDLESSNYARVIKFNLNRYLGKETVSKVNGIWYLDKGYWDITPVEFRDIIISYELRKLKQVLFWSFAVAVLIAIILGILVGLTLEFEYAIT